MKNSAKLKKWREKKGWTRPDVALALSNAVGWAVPTTSVQSWEEGSQPRVECAFALEELTGILARDWLRPKRKTK